MYNIKDVFQPRIIECLKNYGKQQFTADMMAGVIVGIVAIPLAIAFGIASGVGPTEGLITAIIAGFIISALGGTKVQIGGPTGAFIVIIYGIIQQFGLVGLMIATILAGIMLIVMGLTKMGTIIKFVPYPVIIGFTGGIALTIFSTQMNDFFGMGIEGVPADFIEKWICYFSNLSSINWGAFAIGLLSLLIIIFTPKVSKKIPGSLVAIIIMTLVVWLLKEFTNFEFVNSIKTIGDLYELPSGIPAPKLPEMNLAEGETIWSVIRSLMPAAFTIAMLGAIESLLSAMVADGVISDKHNSNTELIGQGIANVVVPFFGGIPATGAIARTMTNINNGGRTPVAGIVHALILMLVLLFMGPLVGLIPMPCLAAVLIIVAYNMSGWRTFVSLYKGPKSDFAVLMTTFVLTVIFDLTIAIEIGLLLAVVLFLKRTSESVEIKHFHDEIDPNQELDIKINTEEKLSIPEGVDVYEIDGPYFFGIANKFEEVMSRISKKPKVRIIRMRRVPFMDSTGIHNLEVLIEQSKKEGVQIVLSGVNPQVRTALEKAEFTKLIPTENICSNINVALERSKELI
ncbi:MAG: sulfate permease [Paludibacteraceae bacterium]|nr:sulfate permease [Paludibacteraceae bacterium]MBQ8721830.1 sulfate permease [Paludibacteraceae bacterium]